MKRVPFVPCALSALFLLPLAGADSLIKNGSFEKNGGDNRPAEWEISHQKESAAQFTVNGDGALLVVNPVATATAHVFSLLSQAIALEPDTDYVFSFKARGKEPKGLNWTFGKSWKIRVPVKEIGPEWKLYRYPIRLSAEELAGNGATIRLISENSSPGVEIDDVQLIPAGNNLIKNGTFAGITGQIPADWSWRTSGKAKCVAGLDAAGNLVVRNESDKAPNVYGCLEQRVKLQPGMEYKLVIRAKGSGIPPMLALGTGWNQRLHLDPVMNSGFRDFSTTVKAPEDIDDKGLTPFVLIFEGACDITFSSISLEPAVTPTLPQTAWQNNKVYGVRPFDGDLAALKSIPDGLAQFTVPLGSANTVKGEMPAAGDLSAKIALAYSPEGLYFFARVDDDHPLVTEGEEMWRSDCVQLRIDRAGTRLQGPAQTDLELGFAVTPENRAVNWCWDSGRDQLAGNSLPPQLAEVHGVRDARGYFIAARLSWKLLGSIESVDRGNFGFSVVVNDSDRVGERKVYFLTPGVHDQKYADGYIQALLERENPVIWVAPDTVSDARELTGLLTATGLKGRVEIQAKLHGGDGKVLTVPVNSVAAVKAGEIVKIPFAIRLDKIPNGAYQAEFLVNGQSVEKLAAQKVDFIRQQQEAFAALQQQFTEIEQAYRSFYGDRQPSPYVSGPLLLLAEHLPRLSGRLSKAQTEEEKRYYADLIAMTTPETVALLDELKETLAMLRSGKELPETWSYRSGAISLVDGWPTAELVSESGKTETRPMVNAGYGHFTRIDEDIAKFQKIGANTVQIEIGPRALFPREGKEREFEPDFAALDARVLALMKQAWENNVSIALLISPHYHPQWLLDKYPEMKQESGFLKYDLLHPKATEMLKAYVPALVARLKQSPYAGAIHSICLSNEPVFTSCSPDNPAAVKAFAAFMEQEYGPVAAFNAKAGTDFDSYDAVAQAARTNKAAKYAFYHFARRTFADWHKMLADGVKSVWPELPVHTKIMVFSSPFIYNSGVDPEMMAEFSDYNGNDNYFYRRGRYQADWFVTALTHEIQVSSKPVSVANTENHIIPDREKQPIPNEHIYTALFQQFVTGASTLTTWVYEDVPFAMAKSNPKHDFIGDIYLRPGNLAAHGRAVLDGMRLAPQLSKFMHAPSEVALLYSPTTILLGNGRYQGQLNNVYSVLSFTGYRPRTLSEKQLAEGRFGDVKVLFVPQVSHLSQAGLAGLENFARQGGRIYADAESLKENEYGQPLTVNFPVEPMPQLSAEAMNAVLHQSIKPLPVEVAVTHDAGNDGVFFRMIPEGNGVWLVNLVNYNFEPRQITLRGNGAWQDLIAEQPFEPKFTLKPLTPMLLRFTAR